MLFVCNSKFNKVMDDTVSDPTGEVFMGEVLKTKMWVLENLMF